jgi:hypothetical protein
LKKILKTIFTVSLFHLDPEVVFHTNDVTLNSSIELLSCDVFPGPIAQKHRKHFAITFSYNLSSAINNQIYEQRIRLWRKNSEKSPR